MIITLAKANFSANNIGLLNSFSVLTNLGMGTTYEGPSNVVINGTFIGSITLAEGYKYTDVEVLMDGKSISSGIEINGNIIELEITGVKGNLVINVGTTIYNEPVLFRSLEYHATVNNSLAPNAYVANIPYQVPRQNYIEFIDIGVAKQSSKRKAQEAGITINDVSVYAFDADTNKLKEILVDKGTFTTMQSEITGEYVLRIPINKEFAYNCYFGYSNTRNSQGYGLAYYSNSGCYLSGTAFDYDTEYKPSSGAVGIVSWIYGNKQMTMPPDGYTDIVTCALNATSAMAGNCYVGSKTAIVPADQKIDRIDVVVTPGVETINGVNVVAVDANTNELLEYLVTEGMLPAIQDDKHGVRVVRLDNVNKQYSVPVYFLFNAERKNSQGFAMVSSNAPNGILLVDDNGSPAIGSLATDGSTSKSYAVGHIVSVKEAE